MTITSLDDLFQPGKTVNPQRPIEIACQGGGTPAYAFYVGLLTVLTKTDFFDHVGRAYLSSGSAPPVTMGLVKGEEGIEGLTRVALEGIPHGNIINWGNVVRWKPYFDVNHLVNGIIAKHDLRSQQFWDHETEINLLTSFIEEDQIKPAVLSNKDPQLRERYAENILPLLHACIAIPLVYGGRVNIGGREHMDQGVITQIPYGNIPYNRPQLIITTEPESLNGEKMDFRERIFLNAIHYIQRKGDAHTFNAVMKRYKTLSRDMRGLYDRNALRYLEKTEQGIVVIQPDEPLGRATCKSRTELQRALDMGMHTAEKYLPKLEMLKEYAAANTTPEQETQKSLAS